MMQLKIPHLPQLSADSSLAQLTTVLDGLPKQSVSMVPWPDTAHTPEVHFAIAHNGSSLFLKYYVQENTVLARYRNTNDDVYKDSCVEFFISLRGEESYYNFEFNCLGTCRAGYGPNRHDRTLLPNRSIAAVKRWAMLKAGKGSSPKISWQLTVVIPKEAFSEHELVSFSEEQSRVNFYKCGDDLPNPHYLSWSMIEAPEPNFHLPEFFGQANFA